MHADGSRVAGVGDVLNGEIAEAGSRDLVDNNVLPKCTLVGEGYCSAGEAHLVDVQGSVEILPSDEKEADMKEPAQTSQYTREVAESVREERWTFLLWSMVFT